MSLKSHAENEMRLAGLYDKNADYDGMIPEAVMALVEAHAKQGHSGGSSWLTLDIFNRLINYKTLTPINSDPSTWSLVVGGFDGKTPVWQSNRMPSVFSEDGGKTWYDLDDPEQKNFPKRFRE